MENSIQKSLSKHVYHCFKFTNSKSIISVFCTKNVDISKSVEVVYPNVYVFGDFICSTFLRQVSRFWYDLAGCRVEGIVISSPSPVLCEIKNNKDYC